MTGAEEDGMRGCPDPCGHVGSAGDGKNVLCMVCGGRTRWEQGIGFVHERGES